MSGTLGGSEITEGPSPPTSLRYDVKLKTACHQVTGNCGILTAASLPFLSRLLAFFRGGMQDPQQKLAHVSTPHQQFVHPVFQDAESHCFFPNLDLLCIAP